MLNHHISMKINLNEGLDIEKPRNFDKRKSETWIQKSKSSKIINFLNAKHRSMTVLEDFSYPNDLIRQANAIAAKPRSNSGSLS